MQYEHFVIQIRADVEGYHAQVVESPCGEGRSERFTPPRLDSDWSKARGNVDATERELEHEASVREQGDAVCIGQDLFDALFQGNNRTCFNRSWGWLESQTEAGLRVEIKLDTQDPRVTPLARYPWELLHPSPEIGFLCLSRTTPIVRYLEVLRASHQRPLPTPFRILLVTARPHGTVPLDADREAALLRAACPEETVELERLDHATVRSLRRTLQKGTDEGIPHHAIHFIGHGRFLETPQEGSLLFEDDAGAQAWVTGQRLAMQLRDLPELRFVFLNACRSASSPSFGDAFKGMAASLVQAGVPVVLAMQFPIRDRDAVILAGDLYERLALGDSVDVALTKARGARFDDDPEGMCWAAPALFTRVKDCKLFESTASRSYAAGGTVWSLDWLTSRAGVEAPPLIEPVLQGDDRSVLAAHVGPTLVIGRCHDYQLRPEAADRLRQVGEERVHWVVSWNDPNIPQLVARLAWNPDSDTDELVLENLTDYSAHPMSLVFSRGSLLAEPVGPGQRCHIPAPRPGADDLVIRSGSDLAREIVRLALDRRGDDLTVLRTREVRFSPSGQVGEGPFLHFVAFWFPLPMKDLCRRLEFRQTSSHLSIADDLPIGSVRLGELGSGLALWLTRRDAARDLEKTLQATTVTHDRSSTADRERKRHDQEEVT